MVRHYIPHFEIHEVEVLESVLNQSRIERPHLIITIDINDNDLFVSWFVLFINLAYLFTHIISPRGSNILKSVT